MPNRMTAPASVKPPPPATQPITGGMDPGIAPGTAAKGDVGLSHGV
jgi:hypothetical protein